MGPDRCVVRTGGGWLQFWQPPPPPPPPGGPFRGGSWASHGFGNTNGWLWLMDVTLIRFLFVFPFISCPLPRVLLKNSSPWGGGV